MQIWGRSAVGYRTVNEEEVPREEVRERSRRRRHR